MRKLSQAVKRKMMSDVPWGVLLSGGLDSSLVASIATRFINRNKGSFLVETNLVDML